MGGPHVRRSRSLQFPEDCLFVIEEIADQFIGMTFLACERGFYTWAEDTWREGVCKRGDERLVRGGKLDEAGEVRGEGV